MSKIIAQLKSVGKVFLDEKQVHSVISSTSNNREHKNVNFNHNDNIKKILDNAHHVEQEDEGLGATKIASNAFVAESSVTKFSGFNRKKIEIGMKEDTELEKDPLRKMKRQIPREENGFFNMRNKRKKKCYDCQMLRHIGRECNELKNVAFLNTSQSETMFQEFLY